MDLIKEINLVGKFSNTWGAEHSIKRGFEELGYKVNCIETLTFNPHQCQHGVLTIVLQGYGIPALDIQEGKRWTKQPWILWHAEVLAPTLPSSDTVVNMKANELVKNAYSFDAVGHN